MVFVYLFETFFKNIKFFIEGWYVRSTKKIFEKLRETIVDLDKDFGLKINLRNIFAPLYKDYSIIGYFLGFIFRLGRILLATLIYVFLILIFVFGVIFWFLLLPALIFYFLRII